MLNGQVKKGLGLLAGAIGTGLVAAKLALKGNIFGARLASLTTGAITLYSAVDAYRTKKADS
jgi:hypothetical protein